MVPEDFLAIVELGPPCAAGDPIPAFWMCVLFIGHCIKWPGAVREFYAEIRRAAKAISPPTLTAGTIVQAIRVVLKWCSGQQWKEMFAQLNQGRQDVVSGAAVNGQQLGLLSQGRTNTAKRRKTPESAVEGGTELFWGRQGRTALNSTSNQIVYASRVRRPNKDPRRRGWRESGRTGSRGQGSRRARGKRRLGGGWEEIGRRLHGQSLQPELIPNHHHSPEIF